MKKKKLILKAAIAMLAFGSFGVASNFTGLNSTFAMNNGNGYDNINAYRIFEDHPKVPHSDVPGIEVSQPDDHTLRGITNDKDYYGFGEERTYPEQGGIYTTDLGVQDLVKFLDYRCNVGTVCNTIDAILRQISKYIDLNNSLTPEQKQNTRGAIRARISGLPAAIQQSLDSMEVEFNLLKNDEANHRALGLDVVSYERAFKTAVQIEIDKMKSFFRERTIPSLRDFLGARITKRKAGRDYDLDSGWVLREIYGPATIVNGNVVRDRLKEARDAIDRVLDRRVAAMDSDHLFDN